MISLFAQATALEQTIAGAIVLCAITIATLITRASIKREDKKAVAYELDLNQRRILEEEDKRLRREQEKEHHQTIETLTREGHNAAMAQMRERATLDTKNLEALGVIAQSTASIQQLLADVKTEVKDGHAEVLRIVQGIDCKNGGDAA